MWSEIKVQLYLLLLLSVRFCITNHVKAYEFPKDFLFGAGTSAFQIEGAWNLSGKTPSIMDTYYHKMECYDSDEASNSYYLYEQDINALESIGLDFYRFSISWSRILPTGFLNNINQEGVDYYNDLIDGLVARNITPMVTMHHFDTPQRIQDLGGFTNFAFDQWFADYAVVLFENFGDRVKYWYTFNEPQVVCTLGYYKDFFAPGLDLSGDAEYMCAYNMLKAHARAYRKYDEYFRKSQKGKIGITQQFLWPEGNENLATKFLLFWNDLFAYPIYGSKGDFPDVVKKIVAQKSMEQGYNRSRLPEFTADEVEYIKGTYDFIGVIYYFSTNMDGLDEITDDNVTGPTFFNDFGVEININEALLNIYTNTTENHHRLRTVLNYVKDNYNNPEIFIAENGHSEEANAGLIDDSKIKYIRNHLQATLEAIHEDNCNVIGYTYWSLIDAFELGCITDANFGLYEVDFNSLEKTRTPRKSALVYKKIIRDRFIDSSYDPIDLDINSV